MGRGTLADGEGNARGWEATNADEEENTLEGNVGSDGIYVA